MLKVHFSSPEVFASTADFGEYFRCLKTVGSIVEDSKNRRSLVAVLYALSFYRSNEEELREAGIPEDDISILRNIKTMLHIVYRRILKNEVNWKVTAKKALHPENCFVMFERCSELLKEAVRQKQALLFGELNTASLVEKYSSQQQ